MSLISLNSRDEDPAEFTNMLQSNLRLDPHTSLRVLGYGINVEELSKEEVIVNTANDCLTVFLGQNGLEQVLPGLVVKIPHGTFPQDGVDLCAEMTKAANASIANGKLPAYCGQGGTVETDGVLFQMTGGRVVFNLTEQTPPDKVEGLWSKYGSTYNATDPATETMDPLTFVNGGGTSTITALTTLSNYQSAFNQQFSWFPHRPRLVANVPDPQQFTVADPSVTFECSGGGAGTDTPERFLQAGGLVVQQAMRQDQPDGTPSMSDDWAAGSASVWVNSGYQWIVSPDDPNTMRLLILRGVQNEQGGRGTVHVIQQSAIPDLVPGAAPWEVKISIRLVPLNDPASPTPLVATQYVCQVWVESTAPPVASTKVDEFIIKGDIGSGDALSSQMMLTDRLNEVWKCMSPGTGVAADDCEVKIASNSGPGQGDAPPTLVWDGSLPIGSWGFASRRSYDDYDSGFDNTDAKLYQMSQLASVGASIGFDTPDYFNIPAATSVAVGWRANQTLASNVEDAEDVGQVFLIQFPNLPIYGRLGATGDVAPVVGWGRLKSAYNGDDETGAYWYNYPVPPRIDLNNAAELVLNQMNVRLTNEWGEKIVGLEKYTSLLVEFFPNPPDAVRTR